MKLPYKIAITVIGAVVLVSFILMLASELTIVSFIAYYAMIGCGVGLLSFLTALIISLADKTKTAYSQGFVLSGGILLLTGIFALIYIFTHIQFSR